MRPTLFLLLTLAGCGGFDPARLPEDEPWLVAVKSARLPDGLGFVPSLAHHTWFDLKRGNEREWMRFEIISNVAFNDDLVLDVDWIGPTKARKQTRWEHPVHLLEVIEGEEAREAIEALEHLVADYEDHSNYRAWPGPNSNTFAERLGREVPQLRFEPHHNAVGKDYTPFLRAGLTPTGTGVELETFLFGIQLGLEEGIELHFIQLTFGIDFWPPALKLPFLPRLGFPPG